MIGGAVGPSASRVLLSTVLLAGVYLLLAAFSYGISSDSHRIALVWLPSCVAIAWILANPGVSRFLFYSAILIANGMTSWLYGDSFLCLLGCAVAKLFGIALGVSLLQPYYRDQLTVRDSAVIFANYVLLAAPASALLGASIIWWQQPVPWAEAVINWWLGEVIGAVLLLLPAMVFTVSGYRNLVSPRQLGGFAVLLAGLFGASFFALKMLLFPFAYMALPLMAIALLYGMLRLAVLANLVFLALGAGVAWGWWQFPITQADQGARAIWAASATVIFGPMILGLAMDEIRRRQAQLATLGERLNLASQSVDLALWDWDIAHGDIYWDERMRQLYGLGPDDDPLGVAQWRTRVHPDDVTLAESSLNDALAGQADYKTQYRIRREDGSYRSLQAAGIVIRNDQGEPVRMVGMNWDVSELVSAQTAVKSAEDKLNSVIEAASEFAIISTTTDGIIEVFSAGAERLLGYTREELVGRLGPAVFHDNDEVVAEGARLTEEMGYPVAGFEVFIAKAKLGEAVSREWTYVRKNGQRLPVNLTVTAIFGPQGNITGYLGVARDIMQQKIVEREIRAAHNVLEQQIKLAQQMRDEFESLFELAPGAMLVLDAEGVIVNANSRAHQLFACDQSMQGGAIANLLPGFEGWRERGSPSARETRREQDWTALRVDGQALTVSLEYSPLLMNGVVHTIVNVYDITAQKEAERALQRSRDLAESANRAKTEFLANMSHEIRTPLNAVLGAAQLLSYTALDKNQNNYVGMISAAGKALLALLNDVLDVSKIEAGKMELAHAPFTLDEVLEPLATIMSGTAAKKNLELVIEVAPAIPRFLIGDAMRFQQVLVNLTGNAIKFTAEGEVVVRFRLLSQQGAQVTLDIAVKDTGIGMDEEQKARLFGAFSQADSSITRRFGGSGLGLTICRKLVELMQGQIRVASEPGQGSVLSCQLVLEVDQVRQDAPQALPEQRRVLIADASAASRQALAFYCERWGWPWEAVSCVEDACHRIDTADTPFDVLIFNQNLDGADTLDDMVSRLPCVKLISHVRREEVQAEADAEVRLIMLSKPITATMLLDGVGEAIERFATKKVALRQSSAATLARLDGCRLLLVEDTPSNQVIIVGVLEQAGAQVDVADNGAEALKQLQLQQQQQATAYDAVLMDVQMPIMDGFTATQKIREELKLTLPIIAMTAGVLAFERQQCIDSGMDDFVGKPLDIPTMLATIARYMPERAEQVAEPLVPAEPTPLPVAEGIFNPERIMGFVRGKPAREKDIIAMIERIVAERNEPVSVGRELLAEERNEEAARHFHTLKGSMGNFGADQVMRAAQALELAIKSGQESHYEGLLGDFEAALSRMVAVAEIWLANYHGTQQAEAPATFLSAEAFNAKLAVLRERLSHSNIEAIDLYMELAQQLKEPLGGEAAKRLASAMDDLRFDEALGLLAAL